MSSQPATAAELLSATENLPRCSIICIDNGEPLRDSTGQSFAAVTNFRDRRFLFSCSEEKPYLIRLAMSIGFTFALYIAQDRADAQRRMKIKDFTVQELVDELAKRAGAKGGNHAG